MDEPLFTCPDPMDKDALIDQALDDAFAAFERGDLADAERYAAAVHALDADDCDSINLLGLVALGRGDFAAAQAWFARATSIDPTDDQAQLNLGLATLELGDAQRALTAFDRALSLDPSSGAANFGRGSALRMLGQLEPALASLRAAQAADGRNLEVLLQCAGVLFDLQRFGDAAPLYEDVLRLSPDNARALLGHAHACLHLNRHDEAVSRYTAYLSRQPGGAEVLNNRASALLGLDRVGEAIDDLERALAAAPTDIRIMSNLSGALRRALRFDDALDWADRALHLDPQSTSAWINRGSTLIDLGRLDEATADLAFASSLAPDDAEIRWTWAWSLLLGGRWTHGLELFEWRLRRSCEAGRRALAQPLWTGSFGLAGRTILLHADHGLGDTIMCARYVPLVQALGARVVLEVQPALKQLLGSMASGARILGRGEALPAFDCHCPLMSLPLAMRTTPDTVPCPHPYLQAEPERVRAVQQRLGPTRRLRVGIACSGNPAHPDDRLRSMNLASLLQRLPPDADYVCLQKDIRPSDQAWADGASNLLYLKDVLATFEGTAALAACMDAVVAVDTSIAHLAAALGRPTWVLLSRRPDWRWLLHRQDTPWYGSVRLVRQQTWGAWSEALDSVARELSVIAVDRRHNSWP